MVYLFNKKFKALILKLKFMKKKYLALKVGFLLVPTCLISQTVPITHHNGNLVPAIEF